MLDLNNYVATSVSWPQLYYVKPGLQTSSLRPSKFWKRTTRWFLVSLRPFKQGKEIAGKIVVVCGQGDSEVWHSASTLSVSVSSWISFNTFANCYGRQMRRKGLLIPFVSMISLFFCQSTWSIRVSVLHLKKVRSFFPSKFVRFPSNSVNLGAPSLAFACRISAKSNKTPPSWTFANLSITNAWYSG